ncbi:uncharacterized protein LOC134298716 [Anolis carolinensis]|uniref:uncharacterized protein LOC134298716 n=1 Tax=Anolis carolinensis TaxID=28377 RepID=UPI002F2B1AD2
MVIEVKIFLQLRLLGKVKVVYVSAYVDLSISTTYCHTNFLGGSYDLDITECDCFVVGLHIDIMDGLISVLSLVRIQSRITADLTAKVCGIIAVLLDILKLTFLAAVNVNVGLGSYGTCACQLAEMPRMTEADLSVALLVKITSAAGNEYTIPSSATSIARPILSRYSFCQAIHPELIKLFVMLYTKKLEREFTCTPDRYSGAIGLRLTLLGIITGDLVRVML